jgi:hypothetical protein
MMKRRNLLLAALGACLPWPAHAEDGIADLLGQLGGQKSAAESGVALLKRWVKKPAAIIQGQKLYGEAKAASDEAIDYLLGAFRLGEKPDAEALRHKVEVVAERRLAFSRHVDASLPPEARGKKDVLGLGQAAGDIVKTLVTSSVDVWKTLRASDDARRETLQHQVEAERWRSFGEVPAA